MVEYFDIDSIDIERERTITMKGRIIKKKFTGYLQWKLSI